jgi:hypothetical protein
MSPPIARLARSVSFQVNGEWEGLCLLFRANSNRGKQLRLVNALFHFRLTCPAKNNAFRRLATARRLTPEAKTAFAVNHVSISTE